MFTQKYPSETFDQALWKQFWHKHQKYHTLCMPCIAEKRDHDRNNKGGILQNNNNNNPSLGWGAVMLTDASQAILTNWYSSAHDNVFGSNGRRREKQRQRPVVDVSDDDFGEDDYDFTRQQQQWTQQLGDLTSSTSSIAILWLRTARARIKRQNEMEIGRG